jgi:hypothetical protein
MFSKPIVPSSLQTEVRQSWCWGRIRATSDSTPHIEVSYGAVKVVKQARCLGKEMGLMLLVRPKQAQELSTEKGIARPLLARSGCGGAYWPNPQSSFGTGKLEISREAGVGQHAFLDLTPNSMFTLRVVEK